MVKIKTIDNNCRLCFKKLNENKYSYIFDKFTDENQDESPLSSKIMVCLSLPVSKRQIQFMKIQIQKCSNSTFFFRCMTAMDCQTKFVFLAKTR